MLMKHKIKQKSNREWKKNSWGPIINNGYELKKLKNGHIFEWGIKVLGLCVIVEGREHAG